MKIKILEKWKKKKQQNYHGLWVPSAKSDKKVFYTKGKKHKISMALEC